MKNSMETAWSAYFKVRVQGSCVFIENVLHLKVRPETTLYNEACKELGTRELESS